MVNGAEIADLQSCQLRQNRNAAPVKTMTNDRFNRGFVEGNTDIDITATLAIQNSLARPKLDQVDYKANDVQIGFQVGADLFTATGVFSKDTTDDASGVGTEAKTTFNWGAIKLLDAVGNSALFDVAFNP
jgi:hypothetical protein